MTVDVRPQSTADALKEISSRLYRVEQESSRPGGGGGGGGSGDPDPEVNTITIDGIVVGADASPVTGLTLDTGSFMDDIWIDADWVAPADGSAGSYDVELARKVGSSYELVQVYRTSGTALRMSALWPQTTYGVRVTAINRIDVRSDPEPPLGFLDITTGIDATIPDQVVSVVAVAGIKTVTVVWAENSEDDVAHGNGTYEVWLSPYFDFSDASVVFTSGTIAVFSYLNTGVQYWGRVRAIDASGNAGAFSATVTATTGQVQPVDLADAAVTTSKLANLAVDTTKLANLAVDASKLADSSVESTKIANLAVGSAAIAALAVGTAHVQDAAIVTAKIGNLAVTNAQIADLAVTTAKIANLAVDDAKIASLDAGKINAGTISADRIAANSLDVNKLTTSTLTSKTITIGSGGVLKIGNAPTTGVLINDQGIRLYSGGAVKVALDVLGTASFEGNISASTITSSTLTSATINAGTITGATIRTASTGKRIEFNAGSIDELRFYSGHASETTYGKLSVGGGADNINIDISTPKTGQNYALIQMVSRTNNTVPAIADISIRDPSGNQLQAFDMIGPTASTPGYAIWQGGTKHEFTAFVGSTGVVRLVGSGDYGFMYLQGGGGAACVTFNLGLGPGIQAMNGTNGTWVPLQASAFNIASSRATKKNVTAAPSMLDKLLQIGVKKYQRVEIDPREGVDNKSAAPPHIERTFNLYELGFMAEELLNIEPDAVVMGADGPNGISLGYVVAMLVKAVQEINGRIPGRA